MRKITLSALLSLGLVGTVCAQPTSGISISTDPAKVAAVERHAAELKSVQSTTPVQATPVKQHRAIHHGTHHTAKNKVLGTSTNKVKAVKHTAAVK
jgi:hypothetical protein